ncbi:hypothetical protein QO001_001772 [Methylobacterium brachiatum]|uniref:Uncharacterized protein n=1 Tax=Methylobacterium brachiatum TaxID=269660 RepID=A0AAJ1TPX0_9HYPH|nr:hypothetical protein [Methylobacterium brachiatum]MCB4804042.1 hypothetical protein [Methylobacterium brachiatum]MDQ0542854.1 hypothetical protein [Methylobacterium brachiatum]
MVELQPIRAPGRHPATDATPFVEDAHIQASFGDARRRGCAGHTGSQDRDASALIHEIASCR